MALALLLSSGQVPSPSFHRPELIYYWYNLMANDTTGTYVNWPYGLSAVKKWQCLLQPSTYAIANDTSPPALFNAIVAFRAQFHHATSAGGQLQFCEQAVPVQRE